MKLFWSLLLCAAVIFAPSTFSAAQAPRINTANIECREYQDSVSNETMFALGVEAYQNLWGKAVKWMAEVEDNKVNGWIHKYTYDGKEDFSCTVWENKYNPNSYAFVLSGTDNLLREPFATYLPMMTNEKLCPQLQETVDQAKAMRYHAGINRIDHLYITGYSLGGYLSNFLGTELVDDAYGYESNVGLKDFSDTLEIENVKCVSYAAPGFYIEKLNIPKINQIIDGIENAVNNVTTWTKAKMKRDSEDLYDKYITNILNGRDPVANLPITIKNLLKGLGETIDIKVPEKSFRQVGKIIRVENPGNPPLANTPLIGKLIESFANGAGPVGEVLYHAPDTYFKCIDLIKQGKCTIL